MYNITLIPGDGIGPEVTEATRKILDLSGVKINWEVVNAGQNAVLKNGTPLPNDVLDSIRKNKIVLKGPITTPIAKGFRSVNVSLRKEFDLYANVRPIRNIKGMKSKFSDVDMVIIRENTEDLYAGIEYMVNKDIAQSIKVITREGSMRVARYAFSFACKVGRKKVTAVHKANIMKLSDGLFLECCREVSKEYPNIEYKEEIVDALCMNLVMRPENYDVLLLPNLYGDIVSDLGAGLIGGLGVVPGANIGESIAIFEPVHGSAPDIEGKGIANPTACILSSCLMLKHIGESKIANIIERAVEKVIMEKKVITQDLGGYATTLDFTNEIIEAL